MAAVTIHIDFGAQENKTCHCFYFFSSYLPWSAERWWTGKPGMLQSIGVAKSWTWLSNWTELMELDTVILVFWILSFKPIFSLSSFTLIQRLFSSSLLLPFVLYHLRRLLIFLLEILILACDASKLAFHMMCYACKLQYTVLLSYFPNSKPVSCSTSCSNFLLDLHRHFAGDR